MNQEVVNRDLDYFLNTLNSIEEEQAAVKRKLNGLLDNAVPVHFIDWAEELYQQILNREAALHLLRNDIIALKKSVTYFFDNQNEKLINKFKEQVAYLDNEFKSWTKKTSEKFDSIVA